MPSLALAIVAKKDKPVLNGTKKPPRLTIPPDLQSALDLLFFMEEQRTGEVAPSSAWFLAEAFGSQQCKNFRPTPQLQHFLHRLLGPSGYRGPESIITYYSVVVMAVTLKAAVGGDELNTVLLRCDWCLQHWGVRERRQKYSTITEDWVTGTLTKLDTSSHANGNPNIAVIAMDRCAQAFKAVQRRVGKLGCVLELIPRQE